MYYGQNGEDLILEKLFPHKHNGFFVEVGCIDGRLFSNTLHFEERGWTGICIEAHKDYIERLIKNRPNSTVYHCAIGREDKDNIPFYANCEGSLSTIDPTLEEKWKVEYPKAFTGFEVQTVNQRTLKTILRCRLNNKIDILSIDIEGTEVDALLGMGPYRPTVIVIEIDPVNEREIESLMQQMQYDCISQCKNNKFYGYRGFGKGVIENRRFEYTPVHITGLPEFGIKERKMLIRPSTKPTPVRDFLKELIFAIRQRVKI